jgi:hypothetical protein
MRTRKLMALKPHKYGTRHLTAGEEYEAPHGYALALVAVKKARYVPDKPPAPSVPRYEPESETPSLDSLRLQATQLGINVDGRWGAHRLQQEIEQAKG